MNIDRKDNIIYFNNDDGIAYGYIVMVDGGYRMAWYAGIVIEPEDMRIVNKEISNFLNRIVISPS